MAVPNGGTSGAVPTPSDANDRKIFVGGLSSATTNESLLAVFQNYGAIENATVMEYVDKMTGQKRSRGFGFVVFVDAGAVAGAVAQHKIDIDGKECEVKQIDEAKSSPEGKMEIERRKIFCGGLAETVDHEKLKDFFRSIDPDIVEARVMYDPQAGRSRCFGYVTFSAEHFVQKAIANGEANVIDGKWVDVKPSGGKGGKKGGKGKGKGYDNFGGKGYQQGGYGGGYGKGGGYAPPAYGQPYGQPAYGQGYAGYPQAGAYGQQPAAYGQQYAGYPQAGAYGQQPAADPNAQAAYAQQYAQQQAAYGAAAGAYGAAAQQPAAYGAAAGADPYAAYRQQPY